MKIMGCAFPGSAAVAVPVEPIRWALSCANRPCPESPDELVKLVVFIETPCADQEEADQWAHVNFHHIVRHVQERLLTGALGLN